MSHEWVSGYSVREAAWHGLATVVDEYPGREAAIELAGHDFRVGEQPVWLDRWGATPVEGWKALVKEDDSTVLNVVRDSYEVVQNDVLWDITDALLGEGAKYETAGVLKGGAVLWVLSFLDEPATVLGDDSPIYPFLCVSTTHDGSGACTARQTSVRVICMNTYSLAEAEAARSGRGFTFRHTKNIHSRIEDAKAVLSGARQQHLDFIELADELTKLRVTEESVALFLTRFVPSPPEVEVSDRVARNIEEARAAVRSILGGETVPDTLRSTAYGLVLAGGEYLDHLRSARSSDTKFGRSVLRAEPMKSKLVRLAREVAA